jgi:hypothetical protein
MSLGYGAKTTVEEATLHLNEGSRERALRVRFTSRMEVSSVTDPAGNALPFLQ